MKSIQTPLTIPFDTSYKSLIRDVGKGTQEDTAATRMESEPVVQSHRDKLEWACDAGAGGDWHFGTSGTATAFDCSGGGC